jgi:hypothetical protein
MNDAIFAGVPDYQAVFLWEYVRYLDELSDFIRDHAGDMDTGIFHGLVSRAEALRGDLAGELPRTVLQFKKGGGGN